MNLTFGSDPEFFLKYKGKHISAHDIIPGTKDKPHPIKEGAILVDGTSVEFNIDPAKTAEEFVSRTYRVLKTIRSMIPSKYEFDFSPVAWYDEKYYNDLPDEVKALGCSPDRGAYNPAFGYNPIPKIVVKNGKVMRTAAHHIHIGWCKDMNPEDNDHLLDCSYITKILDYKLLRGPAAYNNERTSMYGNFGAFRSKSYGMEYRVLDNTVLRYPEQLLKCMSTTIQVCKRVTEIEDKDYAGRMPSWEIQDLVSIVNKKCPPLHFNCFKTFKDLKESMNSFDVTELF